MFWFFFNTKTEESVPGVDTETREGSHCPSGGIPPLCSACMGTMPFMAFLCPFPLPSQPQSSLSRIPSPQSFVSELASETNRNACFYPDCGKSVNVQGGWVGQGGGGALAARQALLHLSQVPGSQQSSHVALITWPVGMTQHPLLWEGQWYQWRRPLPWLPTHSPLDTERWMGSLTGAPRVWHRYTPGVCTSMLFLWEGRRR